MKEKERIEKFVGPNSEYYIKKWKDREGIFFSWNWAALLFQGFWFSYRKMYTMAAINSLSFYIYVCLANWLGFDMGNSIVLYVLWGGLANSIYQKKYLYICKGQNRGNYQGGVSQIGLAVFAGIQIVLTILEKVIWPL